MGLSSRLSSKCRLMTKHNNGSGRAKKLFSPLHSVLLLICLVLIAKVKDCREILQGAAFRGKIIREIGTL